MPCPDCASLEKEKAELLRENTRLRKAIKLVILMTEKAQRVVDAMPVRPISRDDFEPLE